MTDELREVTPESKTGNQTTGSVVIPPAPTKSREYLWIILGTAALICICSVICLALFGTGVGKIMVERAPIETVLDTFMKDMKAKDIESAYALFSPRVQKQVSMD